jgi:hypothetical protein
VAILDWIFGVSVEFSSIISGIYDEQNRPDRSKAENKIYMPGSPKIFEKGSETLSRTIGKF